MLWQDAPGPARREDQAQRPPAWFRPGRVCATIRPEFRRPKRQRQNPLDKLEFHIRSRFRHALKEAGIPDGSHLLVAVSGGCDSVSLLRLCASEAGNRRWTITVGHIDHGLRADSAADAAWVADLARSLELGYRRLRVASAVWSRPENRSIEAAARRLRRRGLRRLARESGAAWILLGHTLDDQAETVVMNLLRGSGVHGLAGMAPCRPPWLRPLLAVRRHELRLHAAAVGHSWREDPTNDDPRFLRNRVRDRLLPLLEAEFRRGSTPVLARTAGVLQSVRGFLRGEAAAAWEACCLESGPTRIRLDCTQLVSYHQAIVEEIVRRAYSRLRGSARDLGLAHLTNVVRALRSGKPGRFSFPAGIQATISRREFRLTHPTGSRDS